MSIEEPEYQSDPPALTDIELNKYILKRLLAQQNRIRELEGCVLGLLARVQVLERCR